MKKVELFFASILVPLDFSMLMLSGWLAYKIRFDDSVTDLREAVYAIPLSQYLFGVALASLGMLLIFAWSGLYTISGTRRILDEIRKVTLACSAGVMVIIILFFFDRQLFSSRFIILIAWVLGIVFVLSARMMVIMVERSLFTKGIGIHHVMLVGHDHTAEILHASLTENATLGLKVVERATEVTPDFFKKLPKLIKVKRVDEILVADANLSRIDTARLIEFCRSHQIEFKYAADIFDAQVSHITMRPIAGVPIVEVRPTPLHGWGKIFKRLVDVIFSSAALVVFSPIMVATAIAVKLDSVGPVIYKNGRVGQSGKMFNTYKFRSMDIKYSTGDQNPNSQQALQYEQQLISTNSIKEGPIYKIKDDPRVTSVGRFIRKFSLDEFPQFFNVLKGDMSLVGPRPHQPREVDKYEVHQRAIFTVKPGVTGLSQISGRSDLEFDEEVRLDNYYMENWSMLLDFYILFKTPFVLFNKRKAV